MDQVFFSLAGLLGALGVGLGAFAGHRLDKHANPELVHTFDTAVRYHLTHVVGIALAGVGDVMWPYSRWPMWAGWLFLAGIALFSGSLYAHVLTRRRAPTLLAPLGGLAFILGWLALGLSPWVK